MNGIEGTEAEYRELLDRGWTISFVVAEFEHEELVTMAKCYVNVAVLQLKGTPTIEQVSDVPKSWPKDFPNEWRPSMIAKANVAKAAALLGLEWDRLHATRP